MPSLPRELERMIFEMAALQDIDHDSRVAIILVAKRVFEWIRPILYRVAIARKTSGTWRNAQITDVAPFTRHLLSMVEGRRAIQLLSTFRNVEDLAIWCCCCTPELLKKANDLPLRKLSVALAKISLDEAVKHCPTLRNITHFEILSLKDSDFKALMEFPNLTHLCFDVYCVVGLEDEVVLDLLKNCPSLRVMIYQITVPGGNAGGMCPFLLDEPRFIVFHDRMPPEDSAVEWERSANRQIGLWELADIIVEARNSKFFDNNSAFIFSRYLWMNHLNADGLQWYMDRVQAW